MSRGATLFKKNQALTFVPWVVFLAAIASTFLAWFVEDRLARQSDQSHFDGIVYQLRNSLDDHLDKQTQLGQSVAACLGANPQTTRAYFDKFLELQGWPRPDSQVGTISYIVHVPKGKFAEYMETAKAAGVGVSHVDPSLNNLDCDLTLYRRPEEVGMNPIGFNVDKNPSRAEALYQARDTGKPAATELTTLNQDRNKAKPPSSIIIFIPVYAGGVTPPDKAGRRKAIQGYVGMGIRIADALNPLLGSSKDASVTIMDGPSVPYTNRLPGYRSSFFQIFKNYQPFVRPWTLRFDSRPEFDQNAGQDLSIFILVGGILASLILFFLTYSQAKIQTELAGYAGEIERRAALESLLAEAGSLISNAEDYEATLKGIGSLAVPAFCDWCSVSIVENGQLKRLALFSAEQAEDSPEPRNPELSDPFGAGWALTTRKSELVETVRRDVLQEMGVPEAQIRFMETRQYRSMMTIPVTVLGEPFAAFMFASGPTKRTFGSGDLREVEEVGLRISLAIENRRLYEAAQLELRERERAEDALRLLNEELEDLVSARTRELSVAVGELEAFCYSVSHDLRAPLRSVDGFSKALLEDYETVIDEDGVDYLMRIRAAAKRMDELITAMLTLSRLTRAEIVQIDVDLTQICREVAAEAIQDYPSTVSIQEGLTAFADPHMMRILMENLITNAVKFSSKVANPTVEVGQSAGVFYVKDNGEGFDPRYSNKLFQPFERLHSLKEFPGTGIGLATVFRVVKRHGGNIWAESQPHQGASFFFTLSPDEDDELSGS